ncbi:outer membrane protein transport protein [Sphingomonas sp.]|uniref:OmpP1/FadL family transporter n=1 Tax=Sphingomonas sp. TaxID=28214 RepID=UPI0031DB687A
MTKRFRAPLLASAILSSSFAFAGAAHGQAFYLQEQSTRGQGRAFSGEAADTGASSLWWNPAAIAGMERGEAVLGASAIIPKGDVVDTGTLIVRPGQAARPVGVNAVSRDPINRGIVPSGAIAVPLNDRVAVGLAVTSPYSFTTEYDGNSWARYSALKTELRTIDIQPSVGIALLDWLRVGGALNVEYMKAELGNALPNLSPLQSDGFQRLKGDGWDVGWTAGVQLHNDWATVGISYKSRIKHTLKGSLEVGGLQGQFLSPQNRTIDGATAEFYTPAQIIVAGRFRTTDKLTLNAQVVRFTWADFDSIRLGAPINTAIPENYRNSWSLAGGFDYAANDRLTLRAGVQRGITPTQDGNRDARVPDANRWNYSVGGSYKVTPRFTLDSAFSYIDFANASIDRRTAAYNGTQLVTPILTSGQVQNARAFVASIGGRFSF